MAQKPILKPESKIEKLYLWLKHEMLPVGELFFTGNHARRVMEELNEKQEAHVYVDLRRLQKKGLIEYKRSPGEKGIIVSFVNKDGQPAEAQKADKPAPPPVAGPRRRRREVTRKSTRRAPKTPVTIDELAKKLKSEIDGLIDQRDALGKRIEEKGKFLEQLYAASRR